MRCVVQNKCSIGADNTSESSPESEHSSGYNSWFVFSFKAILLDYW